MSAEVSASCHDSEYDVWLATIPCELPSCPHIQGMAQRAAGSTSMPSAQAMGTHLTGTNASGAMPSSR